MNNFEKYLKKVFPFFKNRTRIILVFILIFFVTIFYSKYVKAAVFIVVFIILGGVSKLYHRLFKSTIGVDLVLFFTIVTSIAYNPLLALIVAWPGLIIADTLGTKFSHTSIVTLIGLSLIAFLSASLNLPIIFLAIILTILFEIIVGGFYFIMGSSMDKIAIFLISHFGFNIFLIFSFLEFLLKIM